MELAIQIKPLKRLLKITHCKRVFREIQMSFKN